MIKLLENLCHDILCYFGGPKNDIKNTREEIAFLWGREGTQTRVEKSRAVNSHCKSSIARNGRDRKKGQKSLKVFSKLGDKLGNQE